MIVADSVIIAAVSYGIKGHIEILGGAQRITAVRLPGGGRGYGLSAKDVVGVCRIEYVVSLFFTPEQFWDSWH